MSRFITEMLESSSLQRTRRLPRDSGQVLTEACIGLALLAFTWITLSFVSYMSNNHIRTLMAARHGAWLKGNSADLDLVRTQFFPGDDQSLVTVSSHSSALSIAGALSGGATSASQNVPGSDGSWIVTVSFGMTPEELARNPRFPFNWMNTTVPFMPKSMLENWLTVESQAAWPADCNNTWQSFSEAVSGMWGLLVNELRGLASWAR